MGSLSERLKIVDPKEISDILQWARFSDTLNWIDACLEKNLIYFLKALYDKRGTFAYVCKYIIYHYDIINDMFKLLWQLSCSGFVKSFD